LLTFLKFLNHENYIFSFLLPDDFGRNIGECINYKQLINNKNKIKMKNILSILILLMPLVGISQIELSVINSEDDWEKVIITRNTDDIKGLKRVATVDGEAQKLYGKQSKLRAQATEQIKRKAAKQGAAIVLISLDNFSMSPINNIQMEGTAYKVSKNEETLTKDDVSNTSNGSQIELPEINGEDDWGKVIITRNTDDIKGLKRVATVGGEAQKLYGKQSKLRAQATEQIKRKAAKQGAAIVLISLDNFSMSPINNIQMEGTAYRK